MNRITARDIFWPLLGSIGGAIALACVAIGLNRRRALKMPVPKRSAIQVDRKARRRKVRFAPGADNSEDRGPAPDLVRYLDRLSSKTKVGLLAGFFYVAIYPFLSAAGQWESAGEYMKWTPYGASLDVRIAPSGRLRIKGSFLGFLYAPLTIVDRTLFHSSILRGSPEGRAAEAHEEEWIRREREERFRNGE